MIDILSISNFSVFLVNIDTWFIFAGCCGRGKFRIDSERDENLTFLASRENQLATICGFGLLGVVICYVHGVSAAVHATWDAVLFFMICTLSWSPRKCICFSVDPSSKCSVRCSKSHNLGFFGESVSFRIFLFLCSCCCYIPESSECYLASSGCAFSLYVNYWRNCAGYLRWKTVFIFSNRHQIVSAT